MFALDAAITVEGTLLRVRFQRAADGWSPGDFQVGDKTIIAVGQWLGIEPGARVRLLGEWTMHPKYGRQFKFSSCEPLEIDTLDDIAAFLAYRVEEIGELRAKRLKEHFGDQLLSVVEHEPAKLAEVSGISERLALKVGAAFKSYKAEYELLRGLSKWGLTSLVRKRALREWGLKAPAVLEEDPFNLLLLDGVGFQIADKAREVAGIAPTDIRRLKAGATSFVATGVESEGSTWIDFDGLVRGVVELLKCSPKDAMAGVVAALRSGALHAVEAGSLLLGDQIDERRYSSMSIFSSRAYDAETQIASFVETASRRALANKQRQESEGLSFAPAVSTAAEAAIEVAWEEVPEAKPLSNGENVAEQPENPGFLPVLSPVAESKATAESKTSAGDEVAKAFPRLIQELALSDAVVHRICSLVESVEPEALFEGIRMELDATLRRVRDGLLEYLRTGDEGEKEQFSLMVERLTAIAVVATHDVSLSVLAKGKLEKPADWRAE